MNAGDACSGGPSGVGLSRCAGTVASRRARLGRTEVRHAKRAGAGEASMPPPNPLESWTYHLNPPVHIHTARASETVDVTSKVIWAVSLELGTGTVRAVTQGTGEVTQEQ